MIKMQKTLSEKFVKQSIINPRPMHIYLPKNVLLALVGLGLFVVGVTIGANLNKPAAVPSSDSQQSATVQPELGTGVGTSMLSAAAVALDTGLVKVTRVIDGDTIEIDNGDHVRYIGIDTPETVDPRKPVQCFGVEASHKNKELVAGKMVRLEKDITDTDKYGRLLRYVWLDNILINLALVQQGYAQASSYPPDVKYQDQFTAAEQEARTAKRGLWSACPATTAVPAAVSPSSSTPTTPTASAANPSCLIKGNISSSGEKIYHLPGCGSYSKTIIDEARGERWFCTEAEAQAAGWRKALNCP